MDEEKQKVDNLSESSTDKQSDDLKGDTHTEKKEEESSKDIDGILRTRDRLLKEITDLRKERRTLRQMESEENNRDEERRDKENKQIIREKIDENEIEERVINKAVEVLEKKQRKNAEVKAFQQFCKNHPEYSPDKDIDDKKFNLLKEKYKKIRNDGITEQDILSDLEDAHILLNKSSLLEEIEKQKQQRISDMQASSSSSVGSGTGATNNLEGKDYQLSKKDTEIKEMFKIKDDKYLADSEF